MLDNELRAAISSFIADSAKTLIFYYGPGVIDGATGAIDVDAVTSLIGCPFVRGVGNRSIQTMLVSDADAGKRITADATVEVGGESVKSHREGKERNGKLAANRQHHWGGFGDAINVDTSEREGEGNGNAGSGGSGTGDRDVLDGSGRPDFSSIVGNIYTATFENVEGPSSGPSGVLDPWLYLDERASNVGSHRTVMANASYSSINTPTISSGASCSVLGRYYNTAVGESVNFTASMAGPLPAALVWSAQRRILFSTAPLPAAALRLAAKAAGVHLYLDTRSQVRNSTSCTGDGVEAAGVGLLLRGGVGSSAAISKRVELPQASDVRSEDGALVCSGCTTFPATLGAGDVQLFYVTPS